MARFIYQWKPTQHGRRLFRSPSSAAVIPAAPEPEPADYGALLKAELIEIADERGIDSEGTKADIIERVEQADD